MAKKSLCPCRCQAASTSDSLDAPTTNFKDLIVNHGFAFAQRLPLQGAYDWKLGRRKVLPPAQIRCK